MGIFSGCLLHEVAKKKQFLTVPLKQNWFSLLIDMKFYSTSPLFHKNISLHEQSAKPILDSLNYIIDNKDYLNEFKLIAKMNLMKDYIVASRWNIYNSNS